jgi:hypothetical protein
VILRDIGGFGYAQGEGVATLSVSPLADRALMVSAINISNESAADNWRVTVGGRELMRFRHLTPANGSQHLLHFFNVGASLRLDFFEFCRNVLGIDPTVPVPNGQTLTVDSVGGATADIDIQFQEVSVTDANVRGINHYQGNLFVLPVTWFLNASQSAPAAVQLDTQVSPVWVPPLFSAVGLPVNWKVELLALFLEGMGVNTFSGAANHQSTTRDLRVFKNNTQQFTRANLGIPVRGSDSAAGSANTVFGQRSGMYAPFEQAMPTDDNVLPVPVVLGGGETLQLFLDLTGDLTGGAAYANALQVAIARVTVPGGSG